MDIKIITELENSLKKYPFNDSIPDFDSFWGNLYHKITLKEDYMEEKKGGLKIFGWIVSFMVILAIGWFGLTKFSQIKMAEKIEKGEAIVVTLVVGDVEVKKMGSGNWRKVLIEDNLQMGDSIKTGADSYCELQMVKRGIFRVESATELFLTKLVNEDEKVNSRMKLEKGSIALKPNKLKEGENFEVETSTAVAAVRGTKFVVNVDDSGNTKIAVNEGMVAVKPVINSISDAENKGLVDKKGADYISKEFVKSIEVKPGEEATLEQKNVESMNKAIGNAIEKVAIAEGGKLTGDKLSKPEENTSEENKSTENKEAPQPSALSSYLLSKVKEEIPVIAGITIQSNTSITASIVQKQEISEDAKKSMDNITEENIIKNVIDMVKIKFDTKPAGADIAVDGVKIGVTPLEKILEKGKKINIVYSKDGYETFSKDIDVASGLNLNIELKEVIVAVETNTNTVALLETNTNTPVVSNLPKPPEIKKPAPVVKIPEVKIPEVKKLPGNLEWEKPVMLNIVSIENEPVLYKGRIFSTTQNKLLILSLEGKIIKSVDVIEDGFKLTKPSVSDGNVYVGSDNGGIYAYSTSGELLWKNEAGSQKYGAAPIAAYGIVAIPSIDKGIQIYSKEGELKGNIDVSVPIYSAPMIINYGNTVVYATESGDVVSYDLINKTKKWSKNFNDRFLYPLVGDDSIIITLSRTSGKVTGIDAANGSVKWSGQFTEIQKTRINPQFVSGKVIIANNTETSTVIVLEAETGTLIAKSILNEVISSPFLIGNSIYMGTASGKVYSYNLSLKNNEWTYKSSGNNIMMVVGDNDGIYAVSPNSMMRLIK